MSYHCENELTINAAVTSRCGNSSIWAAIRNKDGDGPDSNKVFQRPDEDGPGSYEWRIENWGTEWNGYGCRALSVPTNAEPHLPIRLAFNTARTPAKKIAAGNMSPQAMAYILNEPVQNIVYDPGDLAIEAELDDDLAALAAGHDHYGKGGES